MSKQLSKEELKRYGRHLILPEIGVAGQLKLKNARVLLVGTGGLGSPIAMYLSAAGVGTIGLVDFDIVDFSNLHRQVIHFTNDVGTPKLQSAAQKMAQINPEISIIQHETALTAENAREIVGPYQIIVDATDNFPTRYLINDVSILLNKINVHGSIFKFEGQISVFGMDNGPCYRCLYPHPPPPGLVPSCAEGGVLGVLPGMIGTMQANEVIKIICQIGESLKGRLLHFDALNMIFRQLKIAKNSNCPLCGTKPTITELVDYQQFCGIDNDQIEEISVHNLKKLLDRNSDSFLLVDVREPWEREIAKIDSALPMPLSELDKAFHQLPKDKQIILHCKSGTRSKKAIKLLKENGYQNIVNVAGGITAWANKIDSTIAKY